MGLFFRRSSNRMQEKSNLDELSVSTTCERILNGEPSINPENMGNAELETLLKETQIKLENAEDERDIIFGISQSGQHISAEYIQSQTTKIEQNIESLNGTIEKIKLLIKGGVEKIEK
jgi:Na+/phosphate symporter